MEVKINLGDLLEEIDSAPTGEEYDFNSLMDKFHKKNIPRNEIEYLINVAWNNLLIKHKYYPKHDPIIDRDIPFILSLPGFELLNQIRTKKSIEKLDDSINRFNESSDISSKKLIDLTLSIYVFTLIVVALPMIESIIEPIKNNIHSWLFWYFVGIIGIAAIMYFGLKFLYKP